MGISDLGPELLDLILARLPLRDAARASVLSVAWCRSWRHLSDLDFTSPRAAVCDREAIDGVLLHHAGPVRSVRAKITDDILPGVHGWIEALSQQGLQSLDLTFTPPSVPSSLMQDLPGSIFSCHALKDIVLAGCLLPAVPASFTGFPSLTKLRIKCSSFHKGSDLELIISMSRKLEELTLKVLLVAGCDERQELRMESSSLWFLDIYGHINITWVGARLPRMSYANFADASPGGSVVNLLRGMESSLEKLVYSFSTHVPHHSTMQRACFHAIDLIQSKNASYGRDRYKEEKIKPTYSRGNMQI
ncbi:hypothetical protein HU200_002289 [Digitaria exilis]|uniref:F-box domain-containing protein n=1 Tax=Digitaria exilis TaxID=1010633 RepID=A0A835FYC7_9POAL|nr:hypothetical protein HU200_002289 [Digitaria exilis]